MANNRLVFLCTVCVNVEETTPEDCFFWGLKYYPSTGWYLGISDVTAYGQALDSWLAKHKHGTLDGEYIVLLPERFISERASDAMEITRRVGEFFTKASKTREDLSDA